MQHQGFTWSVTFLTELGDLPAVVVDGAALTGTAPLMRVFEHDAGIFPPFDSLDPTNGLPLGSTTLTHLDDLSATLSALEQGIPYYFRVAATNANGQGPSALASPAFAVPFPQSATSPTGVALSVVDGGSLAVSLSAPLRDGGEAVDRCVFSGPFSVPFSTVDRGLQHRVLHCSKLRFIFSLSLFFF